MTAEHQPTTAHDLRLAWRAPATGAELTACTLLLAAAEALPKARDRRRLLAAMASATEGVAAGSARSKPQVRDEAVRALRWALGHVPADLHRLPLDRLGACDVHPLQRPRTGAEAVLYASPPAVARQRLTRALAGLERLHEHLLTLSHELVEQLDRIEGDADLEAGCDDDANVAGYYSCAGSGAALRRIWIDDAEEDRADDEPELGSQEGGHGGTRWDSRIDRYASGEEESALGWSDMIDQRRLSDTLGPRDDREEASEDEGAVEADMSADMAGGSTYPA